MVGYEIERGIALAVSCSTTVMPDTDWWGRGMPHVDSIQIASTTGTIQLHSAKVSQHGEPSGILMQYNPFYLKVEQIRLALNV